MGPWPFPPPLCFSLASSCSDLLLTPDLLAFVAPGHKWACSTQEELPQEDKGATGTSLPFLVHVLPSVSSCFVFLHPTPSTGNFPLALSQAALQDSPACGRTLPPSLLCCTLLGLRSQVGTEAPGGWWCPPETGAGHHSRRAVSLLRVLRSWSR